MDYTFDAGGRLTRRDNGNGTATTYAYDAAGQLLTLTDLLPGGAANSRFAYTYDADGRRTSITLADAGPATADGTTTYGYDAVGQFAAVALPGGRTIAYSYDAAGNRTRVADSQLGTTLYEANALNQITRAGGTSFFYDPDGNLIRVSDGTAVTNYAYDGRNQLVAAGGPGGTFAYGYDALGNRRSMTADGATTSS